MAASGMQASFEAKNSLVAQALYLPYPAIGYSYTLSLLVFKV